MTNIFLKFYLHPLKLRYHIQNFREVIFCTLGSRLVTVYLIQIIKLRSFIKRNYYISSTSLLELRQITKTSVKELLPYGLRRRRGNVGSFSPVYRTLMISSLNSDLDV